MENPMSIEFPIENPMSKGFPIEIGSYNDGFRGAWFNAFMDEDYNHRKNELRVRYKDLSAEDGSPLFETVKREFIRPSPPSFLFSPVELEKGSIVDVYEKNGWWKGLIVRKRKDNKYMVYFDLPPDVFIYNRDQLRQHVSQQPTGYWHIARRQQLLQFTYCTGTIVEVKVNDKWIPSVVIECYEDVSNHSKEYVVKFCKYLTCSEDDPLFPVPQLIVDSSRIRRFVAINASEESGRKWLDKEIADEFRVKEEAEKELINLQKQIDSLQDTVEVTKKKLAVIQSKKRDIDEKISDLESRLKKAR